MYDSRSSHNRSRRFKEDRRWSDTITKAQAIDEGMTEIVAVINEHEPAMLVNRDSIDYLPRRNYEALHEEALVENRRWERDREAELDWEDYVDADFDGAFGGYSDDPDDGDHSGCWIPFMRIEELRDTFGENWLGNGFHIVQGNGVRR